MSRVENFYKDGSVELSFLDNIEFEELEREWSSLPYSDFKRWIPEDDLWIDMYGSFPLGRLGYVKQLSFLSYVGPNPEHTYFIPYSHTRLLHSQQVAFVGQEVAQQNGATIPQTDKIKIKFGLHDIATVAHGDAVKKVDPTNLHEETHWRDVTSKKGFSFLEKHNITPQEVDETLQNKGVEGKLLDVVDRICYTMQDLSEILGAQNFSKVDLHPYLVQLRYIMSHAPKLGNIYKDIGIDWKKEEIVFGDQEKLGLFLLLRAHLHQALYLNPTSMGRDMFVARLVKPFYDADGKKPLSPKSLMKITDENLIDNLMQEYGYSRSDIWWDLVNWHPKYKRFDTIAQAKAYEKTLIKNGFPVIGIQECKGFNPATNYSVVENNKVVPFREVSPLSENIENIAQSTRGVFIFYTNDKNEAAAELMGKIKAKEKELK